MKIEVLRLGGYEICFVFRDSTVYWTYVLNSSWFTGVYTHDLDCWLYAKKTWKLS